MSKALSLAVTPSIKLRSSQASLYGFISKKYESGSTITLIEVVEQYSKYGNRNVIGGTPHYYAYDWKEHRQYLKALNEDELRTYAVQWFIRNLGVFVVKGLLTAIPTMNLSDIQVEDNELT